MGNTATTYGPTSIEGLLRKGTHHKHLDLIKISLGEYHDKFNSYNKVNRNYAVKENRRGKVHYICKSQQGVHIKASLERKVNGIKLKRNQMNVVKEVCKGCVMATLNSDDIWTITHSEAHTCDVDQPMVKKSRKSPYTSSVLGRMGTEYVKLSYKNNLDTRIFRNAIENSLTVSSDSMNYMA